jgi:predicted DNA-binding transcriptional regulator AlpA
LTEAAEMFGVDKRSVWLYAKRDDFPSPQLLKGGPVWKAADIERWGRKYLLIVLFDKETDEPQLTQDPWQPGYVGSLPVGRPPKRKR